MRKAHSIISIGVLSARSGVSVSKIRYYESIGLLRAIRTKGGNRLFLRADNRRLGFIAIAQNLGYSLDEIRALLNQLPNDRNPTRSDWAKIAKRFKRDINAKIKALENTRDKLDGCIGCGCLSLDRCALYNPDDEAAKRGNGAVFVKG